MKPIIVRIGHVVIFASLLVFGVILTDGQRGNKSIVASVEAADDNDDDNSAGKCRQDCSLQSLKGCFGFTITGALIPPNVFTGPLTGIALTNFDGHGSLTQVDTVSVNGFPPIIGRSAQGTYTVNPDCTGSATINIAGQPPTP